MVGAFSKCSVIYVSKIPLNVGSVINTRHIFLRMAPFLFVLLWSTGFIGAKYALPFIEPFYLLFIRMVITIGVFVFLCILFKVKPLTKVQAGHQMVTGFLVHGVYLGGVFAAIKWGLPSGITSIVVGVQPVLTAFLSWGLYGNTLVFKQWSGLLLGFAGVVVVLLSTGNNDISSIVFSWPSLVAVLAALFGISIGTLYQKKFGGGVNLLAGTLWQYVSSALLLGVLTWSFETRIVIWHPQLIAALCWLIFGLSLSAILLLMYMIREGEASKVASYFYLVPPVTVVEAWFLFGERLNSVSIAAIFATIIGVYMVVKPRRRVKRLE